MCLTIDLSTHKTSLRVPKPAIAKKPIKCYKIVSWVTGRNPSSKKKKTFRSRFQGFLYELNKTYEADMRHEIKSPIYRIDIHEGIHSYTNSMIFSKITGYNNYPAHNVAVLECEIPIGAKYYYGLSGDIVSDKLKTLKALGRKELEELSK